jgi:hypothetical protein
MRGRSAKRKAPLELGENLRAYVFKINSLTILITTRCRGICATSAYKKARVASDEAVFCCLFRTLRLLSELRRRGHPEVVPLGGSLKSTHIIAKHCNSEIFLPPAFLNLYCAFVHNSTRST